VDQGGLPAESLSAGLTLRDALQIADLDLRLSGGGRLAGEGVLKGATLLLDLAAQSLNAAALHGGLVRTKLAGAVRTRLALNEQALDVDLHDPRFVVHTRLALGKSGLRVDSLRLAAQEAQLEFSGRLALAGAGDFSGRGSLKNFDPSRFGQAGFFPAARLNGEFAAEGSLHPALALGLRFQLSDSRGAAKTPGLSGNGVVDLAGRHLRRVDLALEVAGNRFSAKGALGAPDEKLELLLAAPALDRIGVPGLSGDVEGRVVAGGSLDNPHLAGEVHAERLAAAGLGELRGLALEGRLDSGAQGELAGKLRLASLASPSRKPLLNAVRIDAEGVRNQHRLSAEGRLDGRRKLHLRLDGGFAGLELNAWHGVLSEFLIASARGRETPFLRLAAAVPLHLSAPLLSLGPADLQGVGWSAHLARLSRQEKDGQRAGWQGAGWVRGLPVQDLLAEFSESSELAAPPASDQAKSRQAIAALRVSGDWELSLGESLSGSTRWARDSGDLRVGNVDLGLDQAELSVGIRAGHLQGNLKVHGKTLGSLAGEIDGQLASGTGQGGLFDGRAPLRGQLRVRVPDLSWAGGLAGEAFQFAGGLTGAVTVSGSADQAVLSGEWRGEDLALRQLDQGLRLERGTLLADLAGGVATGDMRLRLRQLSFASDFQPLPRVLALDGGIDGAALTSLPGRLEGSGELWLGRSDASLKLRFDRVGLVQRPDQWLMVSGSGELTLGERVLDATGRWRIDAGYWALAGSGKPQLSDDVVTKNEGARRDSAAASRWLALNLDIDLGNSFHFFGAGLESRLAGALKIKSSGGSLPRASGSIQSVGGRFDAYGQKLEIERGIVNFQGLIDNPGLNVRAMRKNQAVEAGVEVTGTVQRPTIRLVSDPQVPDAEKLSWLILGQATDQPSAQDTSRLLAAAGSLFGGQEGGTLRRLQQRLGVDEFAINSGSLDGSGRRIGSRVVSTTGFGASETVSGQIVSVGKRLSSNALLSYEQSLTTTGSIVKLSVDINRDFSVVGRAGSDNALDFFWNYRFGR
jgi:translocation and assembly module TamB